MKREVLVAIFIGISIGLVFTFGIWLANKSLKEAGLKPKESPKIAQGNPTPSLPPPTFSNFNLSTPEDNLLTVEKSTSISGQNEPSNILIILSENSQYILPSTNSSSFTKIINLDSGYNRIKVISLGNNGQQSVLSRLVTYSNTASLFTDSAITPKISPVVSPSNTLRDSVKEKVAQEIAQIRQNSSKKAYLGSISTKVDATISIITLDNTPRQVTTTAETIIKLKSNAEGTIQDLKTGDYLLCMGDADSAGNLVAKRILVLDKPKDDPRQILSGEVKAFTNKTLTVNQTVLNITKDTLIQPGKYKFKDIDPGFKLVVIYTPSTTPLIYVVSEK